MDRLIAKLGISNCSHTRGVVGCNWCRASYLLQAFNQCRSNVQATHIRRRSQTSIQRRNLNVASICKINVNTNEIRRRVSTLIQRRALNVASICIINIISTESQRQITTYIPCWSNGDVPIGDVLDVKSSILIQQCLNFPYFGYFKLSFVVIRRY